MAERNITVDLVLPRSTESLTQQSQTTAEASDDANTLLDVLRIGLGLHEGYVADADDVDVLVTDQELEDIRIRALKKAKRALLSEPIDSKSQKTMPVRMPRAARPLQESDNLEEVLRIGLGLHGGYTESADDTDIQITDDELTSIRLRALQKSNQFLQGEAKSIGEDAKSVSTSKLINSGDPQKTSSYSNDRAESSGLRSRQAKSEVALEYSSRSSDYETYFGSGLGSENLRFANPLRREFGLAEPKINTQIIYILLSADWDKEEIYSQDACDNSFSSIRDDRFDKRIVRQVLEWLIDDSARYPGHQELRFALVGTNPERNEDLPSYRTRLRMKMKRADVSIFHLPKISDFSRAYIEFEIAAGLESPNIFVVTGMPETQRLGIPEGCIANGINSDLRPTSIKSAILKARMLLETPTESISEDLRDLRGRGPSGQLAAWIALLYLRLRDLACSRKMIDESALRYQHGFLRGKRVGKNSVRDPILAKLIESAGDFVDPARTRDKKLSKINDELETLVERLNRGASISHSY